MTNNEDAKYQNEVWLQIFFFAKNNAVLFSIVINPPTVIIWLCRVAPPPHTYPFGNCTVLITAF